MLRRVERNQYLCQHCNAVSLVEDQISERLDQVLNQVKDAAAERLANEQSQRHKTVNRNVGKLMAMMLGLVMLVTVVNIFFASKKPKPTRTVVAQEASRIATDGLKLSEPLQVLTGSGSSLDTELLVMARNETGRPLERVSVQAKLYDGEQQIGNVQERVPLDVLGVGESAPLLFRVPNGKNLTRQELIVQTLSEARRVTVVEPLRLERARLVQQQDNVRLVAYVPNTHASDSLASVEVLAMAYDAAGGLVGFGNGHSAGEIKPGAKGLVEVTLTRWKGAAAIASWDYRVNAVLQDTGGQRRAVLAPQRVIAVATPPEPLDPGLRVSARDLLLDEAERFDVAQLEFTPLVLGRSESQDPVYLTELVNHSKDKIVLSPGAVISLFNGNKAVGTDSVHGITALYPGERRALTLKPTPWGERITQTRVLWKPMRQAALPGPRVPLQLQITGKKAGISSVLVNFSQRFSYKYVEVSGTASNPGSAVIGKLRIWVSLRDKEGKISGYEEVKNVPTLAPGESVPFQARVVQNGRDFFSAEAVYQIGD